MSEFSSANQERQKLLSRIRLAATQQRGETQDYVTKFFEDKKKGIYNYLLSTPDKSLFYYTIIFFIVYFFLKTQQFVYQDIIIIIISFIVIYLINERRRTLYISRMDELKIKLNSIFPKPKFFYMDAGIIELIYSIREFKTYNVLSFNNLIQIIDSFLSIINDIENDNSLGCQLYSNLVDFKKSALNNLQSIIHKTPNNLDAENKLSNALESLHIILNYHLDNVRLVCNINNDNIDNITVDTKFLNPSHNPTGKDVKDTDFNLF